MRLLMSRGFVASTPLLEVDILIDSIFDAVEKFCGPEGKLIAECCLLLFKLLGDNMVDQAGL